MTSSRANSDDSIEHALGRALVWGTFDEAFEAAMDSRTPTWAIARAKRERSEPALLKILADLEQSGSGTTEASRLLSAQMQKARNRAREESRAAFVDDGVRRIRASVAAGRQASLHTIVFLSSAFAVDGALTGMAPQAERLASLGWDGWEVVATFPRTLGISLTNMSNGKQSYAGGLAGLVDGVFVVWRYAVIDSDLEGDGARLRSLLGEVFDNDQRYNKDRPLTVQLGPGEVGGSVSQSDYQGPIAFMGFSLSKPIGSDSEADPGGVADSDFGLE